MKVIAIDPGTTESAYVEMDGLTVLSHGKFSNNEMRAHVMYRSKWPLAIEMVASYGMTVGAEVFETVLWIGRFVEAHGGWYDRLYRADIKMHLCHTVKGVNDSVIRQRLIDLYGGKAAAIGNKKSPGPLYGIKGDCWAAIAVGYVWHERNQPTELRA